MSICFVITVTKPTNHNQQKSVKSDLVASEGTGISQESMSTLQLWQSHLTAIRQDAIARRRAREARIAAQRTDKGNPKTRATNDFMENRTSLN